MSIFQHVICIDYINNLKIIKNLTLCPNSIYANIKTIKKKRFAVLFTTRINMTYLMT